jgi:protein TonB
LNHGEATYLASPFQSLGPPYRPSTSAPRAGMFSLILFAHAAVLCAIATVGHVILEVVQPPLLVKLLPEPPVPKPAVPPPPVALPQLRKPEIVIPDPPRFETLVAVQVVEKPAPPPPPVPIKVPFVTAPTSAEPVVEAPKFNLAYLDNPAPSYPVFAKRAREQGKVILRVQVDASGQVAGIEVHQSSGHERLDKAALAAVRRWRFVPARSGDRAVAGIALVPISFQLEG